MDNKYYVYVHRDSSGRVFYVGSGAEKRISSKTNRSISWHSVAKNGFTAEKVCEGLSVGDARELEGLTIQMFAEGELTNKRQPLKTIEITPEILENFSYSEDSPSGIIWTKENVTVKRRTKYSHVAGDSAGYRSKRKGKPNNWSVHLTGDTTLVMLAHRIVWALHYPLSSDKVIDHIDGDPWNNKIENLREVDHKINSRNTKRSVNNKSGVTGVSLKRDKSGFTYWTAVWRTQDFRQKSKTYSVSIHGNDEAFRLACEYRQRMINELNNGGCGYTDRHGCV